MTFQVGLSTFTYTWAIGVPGAQPHAPLGPLGVLDRAVEAGVGVVQFADNLPLHAVSDNTLRDIHRESVREGIAIEVGTRGIGPHIQDYAKLATELGSPFVRVVLDRTADHPSPSEAIARLRSFERFFRDRSLMLAIENHDRFTARELLKVVDSLGDWVGICLDTVNSMGCLEGPSVVIPELAPRAINVHLKDFVVRRHPHQMGFEIEGTPAGDGMLDLEYLLETLATRSPARTVILELWTPPEGDVEQTIAKEQQWAERSISNLRKQPLLAWR